MNLWFNNSFYWRIILDKSNKSVSLGEIKQSEWGMEKIYKNIIHGGNPFSPIKEILHPFGLDIVMSDPGQAFYFLLLRPFFTAQKSLLITVVTGILLANIGMYLLLRLLGFNKMIAFLLGFSYGYTTFLLPRIGHPGFILSIFLFPWFYYFLIGFLKENRLIKKIFLLFGSCFVFAITLGQNLYYFIVLILSLLFLGMYFFITQRKFFFKSIINNVLYVLGSFIITSILLYPQATILYETLKFSEPPRPIGWAGAIEFSSDLFGFFIPSVYNYYYGGLVNSIDDNFEFTKNIFENFSYPGILIILSYLFLLIFNKRFSKIIKTQIWPFFIASLGFLVLTLGPFLHIASRWWIQLENGIRLVFPLPFVILHYLPFLGNIRAPGRLIIGFIFLAYIVSAHIISIFLKDKSNRFKTTFFILILVLIIVDQRPMKVTSIPYEAKQNDIYKIIGKDKEKSSLLEIPFGLRDGLTYFGDFNAVGLTFQEPTHNKLIIGGYAGRIPDYIKDYYVNNAFIGYIGRIIEGSDIIKNPSLINNDLALWGKIDLEESLKTIDFLDIKYLVTDDKKSYKSKIFTTLNELGYEKNVTVNNLSMWKKKLEKKEYFPSDIGSKGDLLFLGLGWYSKEAGFRWVNRRSSLLFKINKKRSMNLNFNVASFMKKRKVEIYLNKNKIGKFNIDTNVKGYNVELQEKYQIEGINTIYFIFDKSLSPAKVFANDLDSREISAKFTKTVFSDK